MKLASALAIYLLFWVISAFLVLPFGLRSGEELGQAAVPGEAEGAPGNFRPGRVARRATLLSAVAFALFMLNGHFGWVTLDDVSLIRPPARLMNQPG